MGGSSSGRYRTRTRGHIEQTVRVDLRKLNKLGGLVAGKALAATLDYGAAGVVRVETHLTNERDLHLTVSLGADVNKCQRVRLEAVPMRYGGFRYYARCPQSGRRCEVLSIVRGVVGCRQFHRLSYACQHRDPLTSCHRAIERFEARLFGARRKNRERQEARLCVANNRLADKVASFDSPVLRKYGHLLAA